MKRHEGKTMLVTGASLLITFVGLPILAVLLASCRGIAVVERARARILLHEYVPEPRRLHGEKPGLLSWTTALFKSGEAWRNLVYSILLMPWGLFTFTVAVTSWSIGWSLLTYPLWQWAYPAFTDQQGIMIYGDGNGPLRDFYLDSPVEVWGTAAVGLLCWLTTPWILHGMAMGDRLLVRLLLSPSALAMRVHELEAGRGTVVDTAAADLRRIERDLHDGAQARLVALAMDLGLAKEKLTEDPDAAARMVDEAHGEVKLALQELRDLARGIHPAVLTDRGLDPAISSLAARCTVPVRVTIDLPTRPAPAIEAIAYFTVSELLTNISKHTTARNAAVDAWRTGDRLLIQVTDNGTGGAAPTPGGGLAGLTERLQAVDGILVINSPTGGPTTITAELPWRA